MEDERHPLEEGRRAAVLAALGLEVLGREDAARVSDGDAVEQAMTASATDRALVVHARERARRRAAARVDPEKLA
jgi:hypothetical protein